MLKEIVFVRVLADATSCASDYSHIRHSRQKIEWKSFISVDVLPLLVGLSDSVAIILRNVGFSM